jgi:alpha-mannosidase
VEHGFGDGGRFETRVRVYHGLPRVDIRTRVLNNERFVRYRVLFPTPFGPGPSVQEIPFGAISRPDGIEFPAQNWVDVGDGRRGLALLNRGLPGNNVAAGVAMLSLLRCTEIVAYGHGGGYEGQGSGSGFELGTWHTYDYALVPHEGDWREAELTRRGLEFNQPLWVDSAAPHAGPLPAAASFLSVSDRQIVVSALKRSEDGRASVVRLYESAGRPANGVRLALRDGVAADEADLLEAPLRPAVVSRGVLTVDFRPFEIKTFRLYSADGSVPGAAD